MSHDPLILRKKNSPDCLQFEKKKGNSLSTMTHTWYSKFIKHSVSKHQIQVISEQRKLTEISSFCLTLCVSHFKLIH